MILTYIRRNLWRRKVRTLLMVLALIVGVGTLVTLNATVDSYRRFFASTVAGDVGAFDLVLTHPDTALSPYLDPQQFTPIIAAVPSVREVAPRVHSVAFITGGGHPRQAAGPFGSSTPAAGAPITAGTETAAGTPITALTATAAERTATTAERTATATERTATATGTLTSTTTAAGGAGRSGASGLTGAVPAAAPEPHSGDAALVALDPERDHFGSHVVIEGTFDLSEDASGVPGAFVLQETADTFGLVVGDPIQVRYASPLTRMAGRPANDAASRRRTTATWVVRGIGTQRGVTGSAANQGVLISLASAQRRFGLGREVERLVVGFQPSLFDSSDPQRSAFTARRVAGDVKGAIDRAYPDADLDYIMPRPKAVIDGANAFIFFQSLIGMYGLLSLGVVGLLIRTLVMTNVQEQTRDMAILRILGAPRRHLFNIVAAEVALVGLLGIGLGIVVGQSVNNLIIVPLIAKQAGDVLTEPPLVSVSAVVLSVLISGVVLVISTMAPARTAAATKVTHVLNPSSVDGIGLDDLAKLRERRTDLKATGVGLVVLFYPALIFFAFPLAFDFGVLWVMAGLVFGALLAMIVGTALVFFLVILPFERLLLRLLSRLSAKSGYFVRRTVLRGKGRNTLISLMIVMSATLPTFLSTSLALDVANTATDRRLSGGAAFRVAPPVTLNAMPGGNRRRGAAPAEAFKPELLAELRQDPGFAAAAALSGAFATAARDGLGLREVNVQLRGVDADLAPVLYWEAKQFEEGDASALGRMAREPGTAVIGAGLATFFDRHVGDELTLVGAGRDHVQKVTIAAVAKQLGGVGVFSAKQTRVWSGESTILVNLDTFRQLTTDPQTGPPDPNLRVVRLLMAAPVAGLDESKLTSDLRLRYATENNLTVNSTAETIETVRKESAVGQLFLLILTALTSAIAIFGVFAVIYVSIYGRRAEIGMLKAIGAPGRHLLAVFVGEAMVMTLSATLTGVTAGIVLGLALRISESFQNEVPTIFAIDRLVVPLMLVLMILASLVSAVVATHSYRRRSALEIFRTL